jgi:hypothetical protein
MRLGTQTGSLTNHILGLAVIGQPVPVEGMGATILCWTDRHAGTITKVEVARGRTVITVQEDTAERTSGSTQDGSARYTYARNENGHKTTFRLTGKGRWEEVRLNAESGRYNKVEGGGHGLRIGDREEYRDPSF